MRIISLLAAVCAMVATVTAQPPARAQSSVDDREVRDVVRRYVEAREARDPKAVASLFTADADQLVSSGEWRQGREQVVSGSLASSAQSGGTRTIDVERVRHVSRDVAIADGRYVIAGGETGDRRMWSTFVMIKESGSWRIAAIRNMLPAPPAK